MLASICSIRLATFALVKFRSRELTALNLLPSIATAVAVRRPARPHTTMNSRHTLRIACPLFLRKSAMGLEVRSRAASEPHRFDIALAFPLEAAARLNAVDIAVHVNLQHHRGMISGPSRLLRIDGAKTKLAEIKLIDEKVDHPNRIVLGDIVFQLSRKHRRLTAIRPAYEAAHPIPRILAGGFSS